jgi:hypothetical protein
VAPSTLNGYVLETIKLVKFIINEVPEWLTLHGREVFGELLERAEDERPVDPRKRIVSGILALLRHARTHPFFVWII